MTQGRTLPAYKDSLCAMSCESITLTPSMVIIDPHTDTLWLMVELYPDKLIVSWKYSKS
jgi:hypothetical protein